MASKLKFRQGVVTVVVCNAPDLHLSCNIVSPAFTIKFHNMHATHIHIFMCNISDIHLKELTEQKVNERFPWKYYVALNIIYRN